MPKSARVSAGLLMYRGDAAQLEVFLAHPGGPFFRKRDHGAWTIPKGLAEESENLAEAAKREFTEEIGLPIESTLIELGHVVQKGGKRVYAWAFAGNAPADFTPASNLFEVEWPPRSGQRRSFPEVDQARFFTLEEARRKLISAQLPFLDRLLAQLGPPRS
jgi:predicted NUDIX family NTP pyrophosphohydrolase